jgi:hypothetical protein
MKRMSLLFFFYSVYSYGQPAMVIQTCDEQYMSFAHVQNGHTSICTNAQLTKRWFYTRDGANSAIAVLRDSLTPQIQENKARIDAFHKAVDAIPEKLLLAQIRKNLKEEVLRELKDQIKNEIKREILEELSSTKIK